MTAKLQKSQFDFHAYYVKSDKEEDPYDLVIINQFPFYIIRNAISTEKPLNLEFPRANLVILTPIKAKKTITITCVNLILLANVQAQDDIEVTAHAFFPLQAKMISQTQIITKIASHELTFVGFPSLPAEFSFLRAQKKTVSTSPWSAQDLTKLVGAVISLLKEGVAKKSAQPMIRGLLKASLICHGMLFGQSQLGRLSVVDCFRLITDGVEKVIVVEKEEGEGESAADAAPAEAKGEKKERTSAAEDRADG